MGSRWMYFSSAFGSSTHRSLRIDSGFASTHQFGNTIAPRIGSCLPVDSRSRWRSHLIWARTCLIGSLSSFRPATRSSLPSNVTLASGTGLECVFVSTTKMPRIEMTTWSRLKPSPGTSWKILAPSARSFLEKLTYESLTVAPQPDALSLLPQPKHLKDHDGDRCNG